MAQLPSQGLPQQCNLNEDLGCLDCLKKGQSPDACTELAAAKGGQNMLKQHPLKEAGDALQAGSLVQL